MLPIFLVLKLRGLSFLIGDGDTGWHLRAGEWMIRHGRVPVTDLFSYTRSGAPWFAWEWLWDVIFGWLNLHFGLNAVVLASLLLICLSCALTYRLALRACGNPPVAMTISLLGMVASSLHWLARPHLVTLLFTALFLMVLERAREGRRRLLAVLPLLTILWTNLHGGFLVGIVIPGAYAGGEFCTWLLEPSEALRRAALVRARDDALAALACAAASLVNPYGWRLHRHIFSYLGDKYLMVHNMEFQSLDFHHPAAPFFALLLMAAAAGVFWHLARKRYVWALLLAGWGWLALIAVRNLPVFVLCAAAPVAAAVTEMLEAAADSSIAVWARDTIRSFLRLAEETAVFEKAGRLYLASALVFLGLTGIAAAKDAPRFLRAGFSPSEFLVRAVDTVLLRAHGGRIFTIDLWGGYLIYRFYPSIRVFVDGRSDFYGDKFDEEWVGIDKAYAGWQAELDKFGVDTVLLPVRAPLAGAMKESRHWKPFYDDGTAILFERLGRAPFQAAAGIAPAEAGVVARLRKPWPKQTEAFPASPGAVSRKGQLYELH
ncbi:MAG TPA: hypothetical protein VG672_06175 [Bryobacteraceae bacterium]|nr:hypothetical protein [Bryobacteraceae bacterium]